MTDTMTILTCNWLGARATKIFTALPDGTVSKQGYSAGEKFHFEERGISSLQDIHSVLLELQSESQKLVIRGKPKDGIVPPVYRRIHSEEAGFVPCARRWVMMDMDKIAYPDEMNVATDVAEVIRWLKAKLPAPFDYTKCVYKFSSSQNIPEKVGEAPKKIASAHLYFWCDRSVSEEEWKRLFKAYNSPIDSSIYNPVQPHYTANPIFEGMVDPMPERVGVC